MTMLLRTSPRTEVTMSVLISGAFVVTSTILMMLLTSPELSWDEAYRIPFMFEPWRKLWAGFVESHGPMCVYLAKLGQQLIPPSAASLEVRSRILSAIVGSLSIALTYAGLRHVFNASRSAAFVGSFLLLLSVIRLEEANIIGPHHLILPCALFLLLHGYHYLDRPSPRAALLLGCVAGFGALSSTYIIPLLVGWLLSVTLLGRGWLRPRLILAAAISAAIVFLAWPAGVIRGAFIRDFLFYVHFVGHATLVGDTIYRTGPRWAAAYWLGRMEAPLVITFATVLILRIRNLAVRPPSLKDRYIALNAAFYVALALTAHFAGARNLLQVVGVLCFACGALFDDAFARARTAVAACIVALACVNLVVVSQSYTPYLDTDGYRAFVQQNQGRLREQAEALAYNTPALQVYVRELDVPIRWTVREMPWTVSSEPPLPPSVRYVLMPSFVYESMPADQPMRRIVAVEWKVVWRFRPQRAWELRLYERPGP